NLDPEISELFERVKTMKRKRIITILTYVLLAAAWGAIFVSLFTACNVYEDTTVEIIRCPEIRDTIQLPEWEPME
ncbi:hypothetical protein OBE_07035, partial [human gut metagenome]